MTVGRVSGALLLLDAQQSAAGGVISWPDDCDLVPPVYPVTSLWAHPLHICTREERGS